MYVVAILELATSVEAEAAALAADLGSTAYEQRLHLVAGLPAVVLTTADPARGTVGAALGYPGGGPLVVVPAAVAGAYPATGRDIYARDTVRRDILELHATIDRGDRRDRPQTP